MLRLWGLLLLAAGIMACAGTIPAAPTAPVRTGRGVHPGDLMHLVTPRGTISISFYEKLAPENCANVVDLTEFGFYDNNLFYEIAAGDLVKTGCPRGDGLGGPGYYVPDEIISSLTFDTPGMVAMSTDGPNTNGSQFFITLRPRPDLNGKYTIIGRVSSGLEIAGRLQPGDRIERVWIQGRY